MTENRAQREQPGQDPFELWRQFYEDNEQAWTRAMKDVFSTQGYAEAQGKMLETFLALQKTMRDGMSAQLNNLNVPTRDDVARLGELILGLEEKVDQLDEQIAGLEGKFHGAARPEDVAGRLEERFARLEEKIDRIGIMLVALDGRIAPREQVDALDDQVVDGAATSPAPARRARTAAKPNGHGAEKTE